MESISRALQPASENVTLQTVTLLRDLLMVSFAYVFGWRESTVTTLQREHITLQGSIVHFHEDFCKGF